MSIPIRKGVRLLGEEGVGPFLYHSLNYADLWHPIWNTVSTRTSFGRNIFQREWDLLVVLDTCRVDALRQVADETHLIDGVGKCRSVGSMSLEWNLKTFTEQHSERISETVLVTSNLYADRVFTDRVHTHSNHSWDMIHRGRPNWTPVSDDAFGHFETVAPFFNQDDRLHPDNQAIPHVLTDRAIAVGRERDLDRMVVHYILPHPKYVADAIDWQPGETSMETLMSGPEVLRDLREGEEHYDAAENGLVSVEAFWESYLQNLRLALDYLEILLENVDAGKVVVTADHGDAFGEKDVWGHPYGCPLAPVKTAPWATTTASDERTYDPVYDPLERIPDERRRTEHLEALGYL